MDGERLQQLDQHWHDAHRQVRNRVRRMLRESLASPVGGAGYQILALVIGQGPLSPSDLANHMEIRTSTVAAHLDRLEEAGWLERRPAALGSARVSVVANEAGRRAYEQFLERRRAVLAEFLAPLSDGQSRELAEILDVLVHASRAGNVPGGHAAVARDAKAVR